MKKEFTRIVLFVLLLGICVTTIMPLQPIEAKSKLSKKAKKAYEMILSNPECIDGIMEEYSGGFWGDDSAEEYGKYTYYDIDNDGCKELLVSIPYYMDGHDCYSLVYEYDVKKDGTTSKLYEGDIIKVSKTGIMVEDNLKYIGFGLLDIDCDSGYYYEINMGLNSQYACEVYCKYIDGETVVVDRKYEKVDEDLKTISISKEEYDKAVKKMKFKTPKWKSISSFKR